MSITAYDAENMIAPLIRLNGLSSRSNTMSVLIDPGHGGKDMGATGSHKTPEKNLVLDIAKLVNRYLRDADIPVRLTRRHDLNLTRADRVADAKNWEPDVFVSIHLNSSSNKEANGIETYILPGPTFPSTAGNGEDAKSCLGNKFDGRNTVLAYIVHKELLSVTKAADRGIKLARFDVLQDAPCPAILVECGFLSNPPEEDKLLKKQYREDIAKGIVKGIMAFAPYATQTSAPQPMAPIPGGTNCPTPAQPTTTPK
jgi:N-acetylmuramoyl-L-alanine amidase